MRFTYIDTSAIAKLIRAEIHTRALQSYLGNPLVSSFLARIEISGVIKRASKTEALFDDQIFSKIFLIPISSNIAHIVDTTDFRGQLRTLDAIHIASAMSLGSNLQEVITYDRRMQKACTNLGIPFVDPQDS